MWYRANTPLKVDYGNYFVTFGRGEVFYSPYRYQIEVIFPVPDPVTEITPTSEETESFVIRLLERNQHVKRPVSMESINAIKQELIERNAKITQEIIAHEMGYCRFFISKYIKRNRNNDLADRFMSVAK